MSSHFRGESPAALNTAANDVTGAMGPPTGVGALKTGDLPGSAARPIRSKACFMRLLQYCSGNS